MKDNYKVVNSYRAIAPLNKIGKAMEGVIASSISYLLDSQNLLPQNHLGSRKGISCEVALHSVVAKVHDTWAVGDRVTLVSLDVQGAFDFVSHPRILHSLRKRRLGGRWAN
jgi:hypothetical protein